MLTRFSSVTTFIMTSTILGVIALFGGLGYALGWWPVDHLSDNHYYYGSSVVELLSGILLLVAAFSLRSMRPSAWRSAIGAHLVTLLLLAFGTVLFSAVVHGSMFGLTSFGLMFVLTALNTAGLWRLRPRNPFKRAGHEMAARLY